MRPADIARLVTVSSPRLSPDGTTVAFVVSRVDVDANRARSAVWLAAVDGSTEPYQLTAGEFGDADPRWSPDGRRLAFTSRRSEQDGERKTTLHVAPIGIPGEIVTIDERDESISDLAWSPDGQRLAFTSRKRAERYDPKEESAQPPRKVDRLLSRIDSVGWIIDRPNQVWVVPIDGSAPPVAVTAGPYEHETPTWAPDSRRLAFTAARHEGWDDTAAVDLWTLDVPMPMVASDSEPDPPTRLTGTDLWWALPAWDPSGERIATLTSDQRHGYRQAHVVVADTRSGEATDLTPELGLSCSPFPGAQPPVWVGEHLWFAAEDRGSTHLHRVAADGSVPPEAMVTGDRVVSGFDARGDTVAFTATDAATRPELYVRHADGTERRLTRLTDAFHAASRSLVPQRFTAPSADGGEIDAWLLEPEDTSAPVPLLLSIHGGPNTQYPGAWFDEFQLWASAGFAVVWCNPHGSTGRDEAWARAIRSPKAAVDPGTGWGGIDADDVLSALDTALRDHPELDGERTGVLGGSYGGYLTSWLIGHTDRFAAACSERAVNNLLSLEWASDAAGLFRFDIGVDPLDDPEEYLRMSPITYRHDIHTPVLILHSENDWRCPIEQADQLFVALRRAGKDVEYYRFPGETHELSRGGSPKHRIQRAEIIIEYFRRKLGVGEGGDQADKETASAGSRT